MIDGAWAMMMAGEFADMLVILHTWAIAGWIVNERLRPQRTWASRLLPWINGCLLVSSVILLLMAVIITSSAVASGSEDVTYALINHWSGPYGWVEILDLFVRLLPLMMIAATWRRSWRLGLGLAVLINALPWLPQVVLAFQRDYLPSSWTLYRTQWLQWLRYVLLLLALFAAVGLHRRVRTEPV
jgi:hypothetical protein